MLRPFAALLAGAAGSLGAGVLGLATPGPGITAELRADSAPARTAAEAAGTQAAASEAAAATAARELAFDGGWELNGAGLRVEDFDGRRALRASSGRATRRDVALRDGTIEFELRPSGARSFASS